MEQMKKVLAFALGADRNGPIAADWRASGFTLLRIWVGVAILVHGASAITGEGRMEGFAGWLGSMNVPFPTASAWMAKLTETFGGALLAAGLLTRPAALALAFNMAVAALVGHGDHPLFAAPGKPSKELAMMYLIPFVAFFLMGPGKISLDALLQKKLGLGVTDGKEAPPPEA